MLDKNSRRAYSAFIQNPLTYVITWNWILNPNPGEGQSLLESLQADTVTPLETYYKILTIGAKCQITCTNSDI